MAQTKKGLPKREFNPASLTQEEIEAVVEHYLGVHPRYLVYPTSVNINVDVWNMRRDRKNFNGFLPKLREMMII